MAELVLDGVTKRYPDGALAVYRMNLEVGDGEFVILVGPSGCGKTTTLNMIAGLEDITDGELRIDGEVVNDKAPKDRDIAMVFQNYALYPHLTVRDNLAFPLTLAKASPDVIREKVEGAARVLELTEHLERKPSQLSGGQRQRVAMGRAIVRDPKAFLMDEPLSNLDAKLRMQMRTQLSRIQKRLDATTVYVTHDQTEAMTLGDRVVVMRAGHVQQIGTPRELYDSPTNFFVAGFIGSPAMNFLPATIETDRLRTPIGDVRLTDAQRSALESRDVGREVVAGLRPEAFEDAALVDASRAPGGTFTATVDILESTGPDVHAYLELEDARGGQALLEAQGAEHDGNAADFRSRNQVVVRLDPETQAREGHPLKVWFDPRKLYIFDPRSTENLVA
ncbi:MAG: sn-glycerol-3-phosphate ABC transporter ATP-binding protein UgpC [Gemmatimonas sp.]|nr:sn-glycerol-3-phosphate ABC transporter ATP-binding protein UgpC [Gemmatimonas sp.]